MQQPSPIDLNKLSVEAARLEAELEGRAGARWTQRNPASGKEGKCQGSAILTQRPATA